MLKGISVSSGVAIGKAYLLDRSRVCVLKKKIQPRNIEKEINRFQEAIDQSKRQLQEIKNKAGKVADKYAIILDTYMLLLDDEILVSETIENIRSEQVNAEWSLTLVLNKFNTLFENMNDEYLKGKQDDLDLVVHRILRNLLGHDQETLADVSEPVVVISHSLSPSDTLTMSRNHVLGMATEVGGKTSHIGIFSSALGIPAVVGIKDLTFKVNTGDQVIIDAIEGEVIVNPDKAVLKTYLKKKKNYQNYENKLLEEIDLTAETLDGRPIHLAANIEMEHEIKSVKKFGARGVGLFRTEFLYLTSSSMPTENSLFNTFKKVIEGAEPHPVVIRTLDIGGDKLLKNGGHDREDNPALGLRGIRMSLHDPEFFIIQIRAILRASLFGKVKILYPMISNVDEIAQANEILEKVKKEFLENQIPFDDDIEIGAMIETPAAALSVKHILKVVDFISVGTNDLIQYVMAVDRTNENVAHLYQPFHPAVLKILKEIFLAAEQSKKPLTICGELGGDPRATMLLLGLGRVDQLSMDPHSIPKVKKIIRNIRLDQAREFANQVLEMSSIKEINQFISKEMRTRFPSDFDRDQTFEEKPGKTC